MLLIEYTWKFFEGAYQRTFSINDVFDMCNKHLGGQQSDSPLGAHQFDWLARKLVCILIHKVSVSKHSEWPLAKLLRSAKYFERLN